jgi:transposase
MAKRLVSDELWAAVEPLLPPERKAGTRGHPPVPNRVALGGIIFVLKTGIPWEYFPQELGCSGMTLWRRLRDWQRADVWTRLHRAMLQRLADAGRIDWSRASADASRVPAKGGGAGTGPNPTDRGKPGAHHHILTERGGAPLVIFSTAANANEGTVLARLVDAVPPLKQPPGRPGRPRRRPDKLHADKAYASKKNRTLLRQRGITPRIARPKVDTSRRLGRYRWVAERSFAWLHRNRRLLVRYERDPELHDAFLHLGCALICWQLLDHEC